MLRNVGTKLNRREDFHELGLPAVSECPVSSTERQTTMSTEICTQKRM